MAQKSTKNERITLESPVGVLPGVGPSRAAAYEKAGVRTLEDLIYHMPRAYENRGDLRLLCDAREDGKTALLLTVATQPSSARLKGHMTIVKFRAFDESGSCEVVFFNQPYLKSTFTVGSEWRFYGKVETRKGKVGKKLSLSSPAFEPISTEMKPLFAVYPLSEGLTQKQIAQNIGVAVELCSDELCDPLPEAIRQRQGLMELSEAIRRIHMPDDYRELAEAKRRLVFDELFGFSLGAAMQKRAKREGGAYPCKKQNISPMLSLLPYELTSAQKRAISEIAADMRSEIRMSRMLIGDVGCGKTIVAAAAMYIAVLSGRQCALMAPTEILARQHYADLSELFLKLGIGCRLLIGATPEHEKRAIKAALADGTLQVVIGTHALITDDVYFKSLSLVVTDEQHRFGVAQRAALAEKSEACHVLAMSATPIPRSLALVLYGDLDISKIDEMPSGRTPVDTFVVDESYRDRVDGFIQKTVTEGGQVYIVCPSIDESEDADGGELSLGDISVSGYEERPPLKAAVQYAEELSEKFPELNIGFVHGRLKSAEKDRVMTAFAEGAVDVLVSTTVIEVGVNVPNASLMIVENAERFGLSQLHQLRGRVGRGRRRSYCILISDSKGENARSRLGIMHDCRDGFEIAERDLATRGPGDFFGRGGGSIRQSGGVRFRFADLGGDGDLLSSAASEASALISADPELLGYPLLRKSIEKYFSAGD